MDIKDIKWNNDNYKSFIDYLNSLSDENYKIFNSKLIPNTPNAIGIRIPALKNIAKEIAKGDIESYLSIKKGDCHEEVILEGLVISKMKHSYDTLSSCTRYFADKIYNWAICDTVSSSLKQVKKYRNEFLDDIERFLSSSNPWHIRFGIVILMDYYLTDKYISYVLEKINSIRSDFYYVQMAMAWTIATAFAKYRDITLDFLHKTKVSDTVFNMTIKKIRESNRVSKEDKDLVKTLKR